MAVSENALNRVREHRIYILAAILFPLIVLIGFARTYYLRSFFDVTPLASLLVHMHGAVMTAWVGLFIAQVWFISSKRIKTHQNLGIMFFQGWESYTERERLEAIRDAKKVLDRTLKSK